MKTKKLIIFAIIGLLYSCNDLDTPPLNIVKDADVFASEKGITSYIARVYQDMPLQVLTSFIGGSHYYTGEVRYSTLLGSYVNLSGTTLEYWNYTNIRNINYFLKAFPGYAAGFNPGTANTYMGEMYFARAFAYFNMVQRYGGIPIVKDVVNYENQSVESLQQARDKEEDCYNFILSDLDEAIRLLPEKSPELGRVNKYIASGIKARVALYAASIAQFGAVQMNGILGVPSERAKNFYQIAYDAAKETEKGGYALYNDGTGDLANSYTKIFLDVNSKETMFACYYQYPYNGHDFDVFMIPYQLRGTKGYSSCNNPTLDYIEMFDDVEGNPFILNSGTDDAPVLYAGLSDIFAKAEPRLRGQVIFPGEKFKGEVIEVRKGIIPAGKTTADINEALLTTASLTESYNGMTIQGASGIGLIEANGTGFFIRKCIDPNMTRSDIDFGRSVSPGIEMRYAEMLLIRAEAAVELKNLGDASKMADAISCIQAIRDRAGAFKKYTAESQLTRDVVRKERRMELFYESKTFWDLKRWRTFDKEVNNRAWRILWPVYVWDAQKYYMKKTAYNTSMATFETRFYYMQIPNAEIVKNLLLVQNPGY